MESVQPESNYYNKSALLGILANKQSEIAECEKRRAAGEEVKCEGEELLDIHIDHLGEKEKEELDFFDRFLQIEESDITDIAVLNSFSIALDAYKARHGYYEKKEMVAGFMATPSDVVNLMAWIQNHWMRYTTEHSLRWDGEEKTYKIFKSLEHKRGKMAA